MLTPPVGFESILSFSGVFWRARIRGNTWNITVPSTYGDIANCSDIFCHILSTALPNYIFR